MRVKLLKAFAPHMRKLPKGSELRVTNDYGRELISKGIAEEMDGITKDEIVTLEQIVHDMDEAEENVKPKKVKKVTPKGK